MNELPQRRCATGQIANFGWDRIKLGRAEQQADPRSIDRSNMGPAVGIVNITPPFAERLKWCETMGRDISALRVPAKAETTQFRAWICPTVAPCEQLRRKGATCGKVLYGGQRALCPTHCARLTSAASISSPSSAAQPCCAQFLSTAARPGDSRLRLRNNVRPWTRPEVARR
jgi:hypothetical protein